MGFRDELEIRAKQYTRKNSIVLGDELGCGIHGTVFASESQPENPLSTLQAAVKVYFREHDYVRERDVYFRLKEHGLTEIRGCRVPELLRWDDELWVLEMTIVSRPFVLDFAGAYLDWAPDFSEEVLADWRAEKQEQFGKKWGEVQAILRALEGYGVFMIDVNPGNIAFEEGGSTVSSSSPSPLAPG